MTGTGSPSLSDILARIESDLAAFRRDAIARLDVLDRRFDGLDESLNRIEAIGRRHTAEVSGIVFLGKALAGQWSLEVAELDRRLTALEARG